MEKEWYTIANVEEVMSPALAVYPERIEENIRRMIAIAGGPEKLRPHVKAHKMMGVIKLQLAQGITKFKCSTIAEAEMTAVAGARDVMLAYQPVGPAVKRLFQLREKFPEVRFSTIADDIGVIQELSRVFAKDERPLPVYLDLDCGMGRTGAAPGEEGFEVYQEITVSKGLEAAGFHAYDGHIFEPKKEVRERVCRDAFVSVSKLKSELEARGMKVPVIVAGGTPTFGFHGRYPDRECSPGVCTLWDYGHQDRFADLDFLISAVAVMRVISKPRHNLLCLDMGHKAVTGKLLERSWVKVPSLPDATLVMHMGEHLVLKTSRAPEFDLGQVVYGFPQNIEATVALQDLAVVVRGGQAQEVWSVPGRTRLLSV